MEPSQYKILVVDDEELIRSLVATLLSKFGYPYETAVNGVEALEKMKQETFNAVITDIKMPQMDGIMLTREIFSQYPEVPIMVMTAFDEEYTAGTAISVGAREFIKKPFSLDEFAVRLHKMINDWETIKQLKAERRRDENIEELMKELEVTLKKD